MNKNNNIPNHLLNKFLEKIKNDDVIFFDLDGTIVETNYANYLSYKEAINTIYKKNQNIEYNPSERLTRNSLHKLLGKISPFEYNKIIQYKDNNYFKYTSFTNLNKIITDTLISLSKKNKTLLVSKCKQSRVLSTLEYYNLTNYFTKIFTHENIEISNNSNKFEIAIAELNIIPSTIILFENEETEIIQAISSGIPNHNIWRV
ncbi:Phosphoglycolate phosphatase, HAD superfamily [Desulfomicrobium apsheronum]|uniref:Phosphoglycolate phosphatase, HAD superfamily n=1 Tax=Desulfomicrobium apsheronum TaxID=52560 RepID=A0A1I3X7L0_9BACT|nr:HAD hydrolase-like protein [Desulfomicrobium apsheronum]SFK15570.1 Phosphoglycolate phosphatase, HAD superfamily [Desulfomicrobium apsheronum]